MKKLLWALLSVLTFASVACADSLTLVSAPTGQTGPYNLKLNGSATTIAMICYSQINEIGFGETWQVQSFTIDNLPTTGPFAGTLEQYNILGYLADELFAHPGDSNLQNAIWYVLGKGGADNADYESADAFVDANSGYRTTDIFYIPTGSDPTYGVPQPMIAQTPEPTSIMLLGSGLVGLFAKRRKLFGLA
jgi:hypothetical protein